MAEIGHIFASAIVGEKVHTNSKAMAAREMESPYALVTFRYLIDSMTREFVEFGTPIADVVWEGWIWKN